ncbi:dTDP-4-dehydrorhamnose 3,5-epimerase family protein [Akkermansiaceae bacterium]|nr:dTDP-4-dehydrorhamnose 3,5-epimerase family protein [Akkermansiaceae bacterium]
MSDRFEITDTPLEGLRVLERRLLGDHRGSLQRLLCTDELAEIMGGRHILQVNLTHTAARGTVRGMHFQAEPHAEMKFVSCLRGEVIDVVVDVRPGSPTFHRWHAETLSPGNHKTLVIPEGFAHGFQTLTDDCEMLYFHTAAHHAPSERGLNPGDPALAIEWPLPISAISARDGAHPLIKVP